MIIDNFLRRMLLPLLAAGGLLVSCVEEATRPEEGFSLYYPSISEIAPSTNLVVSPTWYGGTPSSFEISSVTSSEDPYEDDCFKVDGSTGAFSIIGSDNLPTGVYVVGISCLVGGSKHTFPEALTVKMMNPLPDGVLAEPAVLTVSMDDVRVTGEGKTLPVSKISPDGENILSIKSYTISNVYLNGNLANECKDWFKISDSGVLSIVPDNGAMVGGRYTIDLKLTTYMSGDSSEKGIFKDAVTVNVTSAPLDLSFLPAAAKVEKGFESKAPAPSVTGSLDGLKYSIKSVSPDNSAGITVDEATGVLTFPASTSLAAGSKYTVSLTLKNDYGSTDFDAAYEFEVIDYIAPITKFSYADIEENISGVSFTNAVSEMDGGEVRYSFVDLPSELSALRLDLMTGTVSNPVGSALPVGDWTVKLRAENVKGSADASFRLKVVPNPNHFTYVCWGNNLGPDGTALTPLRKYGNQFRQTGTTTLRFTIQESDIPEGRPVKYEFSRPSTSYSGLAFNAAAARIEVYSKTAPVVTFGLIKVTVGEGEAAVSKKFPVFVDWDLPTAAGKNKAGYRITYTPFVFRVNPKTGGRSVSPVVLDPDGVDVSDKVSLDYRANPFFWNINGPASHTEDAKLGNAQQSCFLRFPWAKYYYAINQTPNYGAMNPVSYYLNYKNGRLPYCPLYTDASTLQVVVNPEKFVDDDGVYADGAIYMTFNFYGSAANFDCQNGNASCDQVNRLFIWLDPEYTE